MTTFVVLLSLQSSSPVLDSKQLMEAELRAFGVMQDCRNVGKSGQAGTQRKMGKEEAAYPGLASGRHKWTGKSGIDETKRQHGASDTWGLLEVSFLSHQGRKT